MRKSTSHQPSFLTLSCMLASFLQKVNKTRPTNKTDPLQYSVVSRSSTRNFSDSTPLPRISRHMHGLQVKSETTLRSYLMRRLQLKQINVFEKIFVISVRYEVFLRPLSLVVSGDFRGIIDHIFRTFSPV